MPEAKVPVAEVVANQVEQPASVETTPSPAEAAPQPAAETPPQEIPVQQESTPAPAAEPEKSALEKLFEAAPEADRKKVIYEYTMGMAKEKNWNVTYDRIDAFALMFKGNITEIDTVSELRQKLTDFNGLVEENTRNLVSGGLPINGNELWPVDQVGHTYFVEHPKEDLYHIARFEGGRGYEYLSKSWLGSKNFNFKDIKKFFGAK